ncbi:response regulator [Paenibacillus sp. PAMC21692]|uniref:response regulator n=1 Tax=Paenibacillus sp. PAMC21692 TaxID=2762320 RepID=UPI00164DF70A|nr:response regulator [Paenibacillus sp. PAMC21692]QNK56836.1 response regulator [Paenibacillus sp. PAMC21692]
MYRMLIVDDLPVIVEGLVKMFGKKKPELELHQAYSAYQALDVLSRTGIDIVLSDIRMPGMEGTELLHEIKRRWPQCKVIFLTSFDDFHYVKDAISGGGFDYLLKTESDEGIVRSIDKAIAELDAQAASNRKLLEASFQSRKAVLLLQQQYINELLKGRGPLSEASVRTRLRELEIDLSAELPVYVLLGRIDSWGGKGTREGRKLMLYAVQNIAAEKLQLTVRLAAAEVDGSNVAWLLQPTGSHAEVGGDSQNEAEKNWFEKVYGELDTIQANCREAVGLEVSFAIAPAAVRWESLPETYDALLSLLWGEQGTGSEVRLRSLTGPRVPRSSLEAAKTKLANRKMKKIGLLSHYLENGGKADFDNLLDEIIEHAADENRSGFVKLEVYHGLASVFLSYFNQYPLDGKLVAQIGLDRLSHADVNLSWEELRSYFRKLAELLFDNRDQTVVEDEHSVVLLINEYIDSHLAEDVSLAKLAGIVHLNPSYLSRLYKRMAGVGLSEYINMARIEKAKELLKQSAFKIYEISAMVGYDSRLSFIRFFKANMGMTPQEYRDS